MTDFNAAVELRVLGPRAVLLGTGDGDSLQNIDTTILPNGAECYVISSLSPFRLHKDDSTTPPDGVNVIQPASGPGRWFIETNSGAGIQVEDETGTVLPFRPLIQTRGQHPEDTGTAIRLNDGENDPLAYASLSAAVAANPGSQIVLIDQVHVLDASILDPTVTLVFRQGAVLQVPANRTIGVQCDMTSGGLIRPANGVTVTHTAPVELPDTAQGWDVSLGGSVIINRGARTYVTPKQFGAAGNGIANDTVPMQGAVSAILGQALFMTAGTYNCSMITIGGPLVFYGEGQGKSIIKLVTTDQDTNPLLFVPSDDVTLRDFTLDGNQAAYTPIPGQQTTVRFLTKAGVIFSDIVAPTITTTTAFKNILVEDVEIKNTFGTAMYGFNISNWRTVTCHLHDMFHGIFDVNLNAMGTCSDFHVIDCVFKNITNGDPVASADAVLPHQIDGVVVSGNSLDTVARCFLKMEFCARAAVTGNTMIHNQIDNFPGIQSVGTPGADIIGNTIDDFGAGILVDGTNIDTVTFAPGNAISDNVIRSTRGPSIGDGIIVTSGGDDYSISDNVIQNTQRNGIHVDGAFNRLSVTGNVIETGGADNTFGIAIGPSSVGLGNITDLIVSDNNVKALGISGGIFLGLVGGPATITNFVASDNCVEVATDRPGLAGQFCLAGLLDGNVSNGNCQFPAVNGNAGIAVGSNNFGSVFLCDGALRIITLDAQTIAPTDRTIGIDIAGASRNVTLPDTQITEDGKLFIVKDVRGDAGGGNPITILPPVTSSINGLPNVQITTNFGVQRLFSDSTGNHWFTA